MERDEAGEISGAIGMRVTNNFSLITKNVYLRYHHHATNDKNFVGAGRRRGCSTTKQAIQWKKEKIANEQTPWGHAKISDRDTDI
jgi:hypothetical protein